MTGAMMCCPPPYDVRPRAAPWTHLRTAFFVVPSYNTRAAKPQTRGDAEEGVIIRRRTAIPILVAEGGDGRDAAVVHDGGGIFVFQAHTPRAVNPPIHALRAPARVHPARHL